MDFEGHRVTAEEYEQLHNLVGASYSYPEWDSLTTQERQQFTEEMLANIRGSRINS